MTFKVKIEKVVYQGYGLGYHEGKTVFVYKGIPGEELEVKVDKTQKNILFCSIVNRSDNISNIDCCIERYAPSVYNYEDTLPNKYSDTVAPPISSKAPLIDCGACIYSNVSYNQQLEYKKSILNEIFKNLYQNIDFLPSPQINYYRNKIYLPLKKTNQETKIGMYAHKTHDIVEHKSCLLYPDKITRIIDDIRNCKFCSDIVIYSLSSIGFRYSSDLSSILIDISTDKSDVLTQEEITILTTKHHEITGIINYGKTLYGDLYYYEKFAHLNLKININSFFQINPKQALVIYDQIEKFINVNEFVVDAYCGMGTIGMYIAKKVKLVVCIDSSQTSIFNGEENAKINKIENIEFINKSFEAISNKLKNVDTIL